MTTENSRHLKAIWFGGSVPLLGHLHFPRGPALDLAVVICATPFGYENIAGHRGLRILADRLAEGGMASLCFDVPGTGDSDGTQTVASWRSAIASAVSTIRRDTGCSRIGVIGVGLGGTLALSCIDEGVDVHKLILWSPPANGRGWLRQQRAYHRITQLKFDPASPPPEPPEGIEELYGFPMSRELASELTALDLAADTAAQWASGRAKPAVFVIARKLDEVEKAFSGLLAARGISPLLEAWDGLDQMYVEPHLSIAPEALFARMRSWLSDGVPSREPYDLGFAEAAGAAARIRDDNAVEEIARYTESEGGLLFSIETRPANRAPHPIWLILLTGRAVRHIGPNRIWVRLARELAREGYASLRLDGRSVGDSDGDGDGLMPNEEYYQEHIYDDIERVMEIGVKNGARGFLMTGICSGATASYQIAWRRKDVRAIVMLNPLQLRHDPEDDERARVQRAQKWNPRKGLWKDPQTYLRALKGELPLRHVLKVLRIRLANTLFHRRQILLGERSYVYTGFHSLAAKPVEIDVFVSGEDDVAISFLERHFGLGFKGLRGEHLRAHLCPNADHTIRQFHAQEHFSGVLKAALARVSTGADPAAVTQVYRQPSLVPRP